MNILFSWEMLFLSAYKIDFRSKTIVGRLCCKMLLTNIAENIFDFILKRTLHRPYSVVKTCP